METDVMDSAQVVDAVTDQEADQVRELLPIVAVMDTSSSMAPWIDKLNKELDNLRAGLTNNPIAGSMTRLAVVEFNSRADVVMEMTEILNVSAIPALTARGATSYAAACDLLTTRIPQWLGALQSQGHEVFRPTFFWLTDGGPTDPDSVWRAAVDRLTDPTNSWAPNIVSFGIGQAVPEVIETLSRRRGRAFLAQNGQDVSNSLAAIIPAIMNSVLASVTPGTTTARPAPIPQAVPGMIPLDKVRINP